MSTTTRPTPPAWASCLGGPSLRGPVPTAAVAILWALDRAGVYGVSPPELAAELGMPRERIAAILQALRRRHGLCYSRTSMQRARFFACFVSVDQADSAMAHWLGELQAERKRLQASKPPKPKKPKKPAKAKPAPAVKESLTPAPAAAHKASAPRGSVAMGAIRPAIRPTAPVVIPDDARRTIAATPPSRWAALQPAPGGFSSMPIGQYLEPAQPWAQAVLGASA